MRRFPHRATLLRPSQVEDAYGDVVDGPLVPVGEPLPAWLQVQTSTASTPGDNGDPVITRTRLYLRAPAPVMPVDGDVFEVDGIRYTVDGDPQRPVNPRGRSRLVEADLKRVTRG